MFPPGNKGTTSFAIQHVEVVGLSPSSVVGLPQKQQHWAPLTPVSRNMKLLKTSFEVVLSFHCQKHFGEISLAEHSKQFLRLSVARWLLIPRRGSLWASAVYKTRRQWYPASRRLQFCAAHASWFLSPRYARPVSLSYTLTLVAQTPQKTVDCHCPECCGTNKPLRDFWGQWNGSVGKCVCCQSQFPDFGSPKNPLGGRREHTPPKLSSDFYTHTPLWSTRHMCTCTFPPSAGIWPFPTFHNCIYFIKSWVICKDRFLQPFLFLRTFLCN